MGTEVALQYRLIRQPLCKTQRHPPKGPGGLVVRAAPKVHKRKLPVLDSEVAKPKQCRGSQEVGGPRSRLDHFHKCGQNRVPPKQRMESFAELTKQQEEQKTQQQEDLLKKQLEEALQEQRKVIDELAHSRQGFEEILSAKNKELELTKEEARAQKEEVVTQMNEVLENELQCIICSEFLIEAVTLNCAHSFCSYCINQWRKKKDECPICRRAIVSQTRCLALDNCINGMVDKLSLEMKTRRQALISERLSWSYIKKKLLQWWAWSV